jgi:hypothetical protein
MPSAKGLGYITTTDAFGTTSVVEALTCAHCQNIFVKPKPGEPSGFCTMCFAPVCLRCGQNELKCDPFERKLERIESRARLLQSV